MRSNTAVYRWNGLAVTGVVLVIVGIGWFVLRELRFDPFAAIADLGWPYFVILPGVILLGLSLIPTPPRGLGFAIAGAIVTTVGAVLLYQDSNGHWESWAYAWALVGPAAAGLGMLLYGLLFRQRDLVPVGARLVGIGGALFVVGYWYFESVFANGKAPLDLGSWWPVVLVVAGIVALAVGYLRQGPGAGHRTGHPQGQGGAR